MEVFQYCSLLVTSLKIPSLACIRSFFKHNKRIIDVWDNQANKSSIWSPQTFVLRKILPKRISNLLRTFQATFDDNIHLSIRESSIVCWRWETAESKTFLDKLLYQKKGIPGNDVQQKLRHVNYNWIFHEIPTPSGDI